VVGVEHPEPVDEAAQQAGGVVRREHVVQRWPEPFAERVHVELDTVVDRVLLEQRTQGGRDPWSAVDQGQVEVEADDERGHGHALHCRSGGPGRRRCLLLPPLRRWEAVPTP